MRKKADQAVCFGLSINESIRWPTSFPLDLRITRYFRRIVAFFKSAYPLNSLPGHRKIPYNTTDNHYSFGHFFFNLIEGS